MCTSIAVSNTRFRLSCVKVELKGVRSGVERRRGRGLKAGGGRRDAPGKFLKDRRSPRERGRMGTGVNTNAPASARSTLRTPRRRSSSASPPPPPSSRAAHRRDRRRSRTSRTRSALLPRHRLSLWSPRR
eukprot:29351-Pelagococcus_subviridis.AAC.3